MNGFELNVEVAVAAGAGNEYAELDELKRDEDEVCGKTVEGCDGVKGLVEVKIPKLDELNGVDAVKPVLVKDEVFGANKLDEVVALKGLDA